jgi:hypothetical protein
MFLCTEVRDPHSPKWLEDFLQTPNQLEYHGTGASYLQDEQILGRDNGRAGTWDGPLLAIMEQPKDVIVVRYVSFCHSFVHPFIRSCHCVGVHVQHGGFVGSCAYLQTLILTNAFHHSLPFCFNMLLL